MATFDLGQRAPWLLVLLVALVFLPSPAAAFGAGNIPSIAQVRAPSAAAATAATATATAAIRAQS